MRPRLRALRALLMLPVCLFLFITGARANWISNTGPAMQPREITSLLVAAE